MARLRLTIVKTGETFPDVVEAHGGFREMFTAPLRDLEVEPHVIE